jgi:hypothetical protein
MSFNGLGTAMGSLSWLSRGKSRSISQDDIAPAAYSRVWFNTPRLAAAQIMQRLQKFGIKPDSMINFLTTGPPF